jgi:hypothetical protein
MADMTYQKFIKRWEEVVDLPPQTLGPLTPQYKWLVKRLKLQPWTAFLIVSVAIVLGLWLLLGSAIPSLVTMLQRGF